MKSIRLFLFLSAVVPCFAATKVHVVFLGAGKMVSYSAKGDPAGALPAEKQLRVRPLLVDDKVKEWTTGESHAITDRSFVVRRALRLNDALPGEKAEHWIWQRGPWLMVDRVKGSVTALHLPDYDPAISNVIWFRDYAAYCGLTTSGKQLYAVVAQIAARKPVLAKKLSPWSAGELTARLWSCDVAAGAASGYVSAIRCGSSELRPGGSLPCWWKTAMGMTTRQERLLPSDRRPSDWLYAATTFGSPASQRASYG